MKRNRVKLIVEVDLDPIPGAMHTPMSAMEFVFAILNQRIPHYDPEVSLTAEADFLQSEIQNEV